MIITFGPFCDESAKEDCKVEYVLSVDLRKLPKRNTTLKKIVL